jgi:hypothetical protein
MSRAPHCGLTGRSTRTSYRPASPAYCPPVNSNVRQHMWGKRFPLAPPTGGEIDVWVQVCVRLSEPMAKADREGPPIVGYFRNLGIRVPGPQPKAFLERLIPDGTVDWDETEVSEVDPSSLDSDLRSHVTPPDADGVWHRSGHMYF